MVKSTNVSLQAIQDFVQSKSCAGQRLSRKCISDMVQRRFGLPAYQMYKNAKFPGLVKLNKKEFTYKKDQGIDPAPSKQSQVKGHTKGTAATATAPLQPVLEVKDMLTNAKVPVFRIDEKTPQEHLNHMREMLAGASEVVVDVEGDVLEDTIHAIQFMIDSPLDRKVYSFNTISLTTSQPRHTCLRGILEASSVQKVFRDARRDVIALSKALGIETANVLDGQSVIHHLKTQRGLLQADHVDAGVTGVSDGDIDTRFDSQTPPVSKTVQLEFARLDHLRGEERAAEWTRFAQTKEFVTYCANKVVYLLDLKHRMHEEWTSIMTSWSSQCLQKHSDDVGDYSTAVKLPLNQPLRLSFEQVEHNGFVECIPRYEVIDESSIDTPIDVHEGTNHGTAMCSNERSPDASVDHDDPVLSLVMSYFPHGFGQAVADVVHCHGLESSCGSESVVEIVFDTGRTPFVRFSDGPCRDIVVECLVFEEVINHIEQIMQPGNAEKDLDQAKTLLEMLPSDNRVGIPGTLHRVSFIRNRMLDRIIGMTMRFGRNIKGSTDLLQDVMSYLGKPATIGGSRPSLLLLGPPGVGKSTLLREITYELSTIHKKNVVVVDTSNEIAGDGDVPHECIGRARRLQVSNPSHQHEVMLEAVKNHCPDVVVIDELGTAAEVTAAKSIAQRGVSLVATAHGCNMGDLMRNPMLVGLLGGIQSVILSADEAKKQNTIRKSRLERAGAPVFTTLIEIWDKSNYCIHANVAKTVDEMLEPSYRKPGKTRCARSEARYYQNSANRINKEMLAVLQPDQRDDAAGRSELDVIYGSV